MKDKELITNATQLLSELNKSFQSCKQGRADDIRLQELLNTTLQELKKAEKLDNSILIDLEKFYQRTSLLIGLGSLKWTCFRILEHRISIFLLTKFP